MKLTKLMRNAALVFGVALAVPVHAVKITPDGVQITPASEPRGHVEVVVSDDIVYFLGLSVEPAYLLEPNNVEIFACTDLVRDPATGELLDCRSINEADNVRGDPSTHPEDKVRVKARIDALDKEGEDAKVVSRAKLGKLKVVNPTEGHYATKTFLPYPPGPIAVRISGTINGVETDLRTACTIGEPHTQRRTVAMKSTHFLIVAGLVAVTTSAYRSADAAQFAPGIEKRYADGQIVVYYNNSFGATCKAQEGGCLIGVLPYTDVEYDAEGNVINGRLISEFGETVDDPPANPNDRVDLTADIQLLESRDPSAPILEEDRITNETRDGELFQTSAFRYRGIFISHKPGPIAIVVRGTITDGVNSVDVDERLVCNGLGFVDGGFSCIDVAKRKKVPILPFDEPYTGKHLKTAN